MGMEVRQLCRAVRAAVERGDMTRQQGRTIMGQAKHGDIEGAKAGLRRIVRDG